MVKEHGISLEELESASTVAAADVSTDGAALEAEFSNTSSQAGGEEDSQSAGHSIDSETTPGEQQGQTAEISEREEMPNGRVSMATQV